jgi:hypothetical protein
MLKCEKPITQNKKELGNKLYKYLMCNGVLTKEQMFSFLGWEKEKDRQLRDLISLIAEKVPIVATSDSKGYMIAKTQKDLEIVEHQWKEIDSRIESLEKRKQPLIRFYEKFKN